MFYRQTIEFSKKGKVKFEEKKNNFYRNIYRNRAAHDPAGACDICNDDQEKQSKKKKPWRSDFTAGGTSPVTMDSLLFFSRFPAWVFFADNAPPYFPRDHFPRASELTALIQTTMSCYLVFFQVRVSQRPRDNQENTHSTLCIHNEATFFSSSSSSTLFSIAGHSERYSPSITRRLSLFYLVSNGRANPPRSQPVIKSRRHGHWHCPIWLL